MKITTQLRRDINAAVRANVRFANPLAEVGNREIDPRDAGLRNVSNNALMWHEDADLFDMTRLADVRELNDDALNPGCYELDLYVTTGIGLNRELETNVGILIRDGKVVFASSSGIKVTRWKLEHDFPLGGFDEYEFWGGVTPLRERAIADTTKLRTTAQRHAELQAAR